MIIAIFCGPRHIDVTLAAISEFIKIFGIDIRIFVFSPKAEAFQDLVNRGVIVRCIEDVEFGFLDDSMKILELKLDASSLGRINWYRQQLMKLTFPQIIFPTVIENDAQMVIWDGDTIPLGTIEFFRNGFPVVNLSAAEYHWPYFLANRRILNGGFSLPHSSISQYMPLLYSEWLELIRDISGFNHSNNAESAVRKAALNIVDKLTPENSGSEFSEYELISCWRVKKEKYFITLFRKIVRSGSGLLGPLQLKLLLCNFFGAVNVSFEDGLKSKKKFKLILKSIREVLL